MDLDRVQVVTSQIQARCGNGREPHIGTAGGLFGSAGQAAREKQPLRHGRYWHGGVFGVFHAEPVVPGPSATFGGRARPWSLELRDAVWDAADSERQPCSRYVGPGGTGALPSAVSPCGRSVGGWRRAHGLSSAGASRADRVRRHGILPFREAALSELLVAQAQRWHHRIFSYAGGRDAGGAGP